MNHDTFESLLVEKSQVIYKYLLKLGVGVKDAEDIVQDTLYKAMFLMDDISLEKLTPWLLRVAINQYRDLYRKSKRFNPVPIESVILIGQKSLDEIILTKEFQVEIQEVLETLNPDYKNILLLKYDYELSYKEISSLLDMKEESVKTNLYRARNQFKALYRGKQHESERF
ncbi:RNA polymerase sigma factor [Bacillus mycoides]|uniref:Sigma-70 family RNA polymerase sigma factor n=1 Tax=Bacillus mycoides TaxID=1405 RepID=A0ABC9QWE5_BACMY|nr:sigma-70 family RNA polymerase sigma factor [Bacillus mycoides]EJR31648.1 sigma-70 family RNA polymerase sigma factor [Bacillus mycoides]